MRQWDWEFPEKPPHEVNGAVWDFFLQNFCEEPIAVGLDAAPELPIRFEEVTDVSARTQSLVIGMAGDRYFAVFLFSYGYRAPGQDRFETCLVALDRNLFLTIIPEHLRHQARQVLDRMEQYRGLDAGGRKS